jgi:hypothetical protein
MSFSIKTLLEELFDEGRYEDAQAQHPDLANILTGMKAAGIKPKYITWFIKQHKKTNGFKDVLGRNLTAHSVIIGLRFFDELAEQNKITKKDINQYREVEQFVDAVTDARAAEKKKKKEKEQDSDAEVIYKDSQYVVIKPNTRKASCKYGAGTKWCISARDQNYFEQYTEEGAEFYFFINKKTNDKDALTIFSEDDGREPTVFDALDNDHPLPYLFGKYPPEMLKTILGKIGVQYALPENIEDLNAALKEPVAVFAKLSVPEGRALVQTLYNTFGESGTAGLFLKLVTDYNSAGSQTDTISEIIDFTYNRFIDFEYWPVPSLKAMVDASIKLVGHDNEDLSGLARSVFRYMLAKVRDGQGTITIQDFLDLAGKAIILSDAPDSDERDGATRGMFSDLGHVGLSTGFMGTLIDKSPNLFVDLYKKLVEKFPEDAEQVSRSWIASYLAKKYDISPGAAGTFVRMLPKIDDAITDELKANPESLANVLGIAINHWHRRKTPVTDQEQKRLTDVYLAIGGDIKKILPAELQAIVTESNQRVLRNYFQKFLLTD